MPEKTTKDVSSMGELRAVGSGGWTVDGCRVMSEGGVWKEKKPHGPSGMPVSKAVALPQRRLAS